MPTHSWRAEVCAMPSALSLPVSLNPHAHVVFPFRNLPRDHETSFHFQYTPLAWSFPDCPLCATVTWFTSVRGSPGHAQYTNLIHTAWKRNLCSKAWNCPLPLTVCLNPICYSRLIEMSLPTFTLSPTPFQDWLVPCRAHFCWLLWLLRAGRLLTHCCGPCTSQGLSLGTQLVTFSCFFRSAAVSGMIHTPASRWVKLTLGILETYFTLLFSPAPLCSSQGPFSDSQVTKEGGFLCGFLSPWIIHRWLPPPPAHWSLTFMSLPSSAWQESVC